MTDHILNISDTAMAKILEVRSSEPDGGELGLVVEIVGIHDTEFGYEMSMMRPQDAAEDDHIEHHGDLPVIIPAASVESLRGATLDMSRNLLNPGLTIDNPNSPSPAVGLQGSAADLSGPVEQRIHQVLQQQINPAIASHGGFAELVAFEEQVAYVRMGGGCQGCGMATVTLSQGIETAITESVPEVARVVDVTDHASGTNPYYEPAKK